MEPILIPIAIIIGLVIAYGGVIFTRKKQVNEADEKELNDDYNDWHQN